MSFLFGNILSVTSADLLWMGAVDAAIVAGFAPFYRPILYVAFDRRLLPELKTCRPGS